MGFSIIDLRYTKWNSFYFDSGKDIFIPIYNVEWKKKINSKKNYISSFHFFPLLVTDDFIDNFT